MAGEIVLHSFEARREEGEQPVRDRKSESAECAYAVIWRSLSRAPLAVSGRGQSRVVRLAERRLGNAHRGTGLTTWLTGLRIWRPPMGDPGLHRRVARGQAAP